VGECSTAAAALAGQAPERLGRLARRAR
jgi:hypothetical protein